MTLLSVDGRIAKYKAAGYQVISHVTKPIAEKAEGTGSNPLDQIAAQIEDGFYQIVQHREGSDVPLGAMPKNPGGSLTPASALPVVMGSEIGVIGRYFKLTRQFGVTNGFTIVPVRSDIPPSGPVTGATTKNIRDKLNVNKSPEYPLWVLRCDERIIYSSGNDTVTVDYFRVLEVGSDKCWKTGSEATDPPISVSTVSRRLTPPENELYEIIRSDVEQTVDISSIESLYAKASSATVDISTVESLYPKESSATVDISSAESLYAKASSATVVRQFYFSTGVLSALSADTIVTLQLSTDARNQGWATYPDQGLWSWFEIAILTKDLKLGDAATDYIKKVDGRLLTFISHTIPLNDNYTEQVGPIFAKDSEVLKHVGANDVIAVLGCAQFAEWVCNVRRGDLKIRELVPNP